MGVNKNNVKIHVEHLKKNFGKLEVLKDVSTDIYEGEVVVILGPSGSGKSTFLRCLNRLEEITGGDVIVDGHDLTDKKTDLNKVRENVGMVFQHFNLFNNLTVMENLTLAPVTLKLQSAEEATEKASALLKRIGLYDKKDEYPNKLSGGQKQRVAIAGVMAMHPKCIVMDEPTAMLDPHGRKSVIETAKKLNKEEGITVILITHYMEEVIEADRIFVMDDGKLVMEGTPKEVFSKVDKLKELRLDVPQATLVAHELQQRGIPLPDGILNNEELVDELCRLKSKM